MGQIANQMFIEWCYKMAQKIGTKRAPKKRSPKESAGQDGGRASEETVQDIAKRETE